MGQLFYLGDYNLRPVLFKVQNRLLLKRKRDLVLLYQFQCFFDRSIVQ